MESGNTIWRYTDLRALEMLLGPTQSLYFARPWQFEDELDGHYPLQYLQNVKAIVGDDASWEREFEKRLHRRRYGFLVSCWHQSEHERLEMWTRYAPPKQVAIQSTIEDAVFCLSGPRSGSVIYYDSKDDIRHESIFATDDDVLYKRTEFQDEREFRMWFVDQHILDRVDQNHSIADLASAGRPKHVTDLTRFIKKIVIAPGSDDSLYETVKSIFAKHKKASYCDLIQRSSL